MKIPSINKQALLLVISSSPFDLFLLHIHSTEWLPQANSHFNFLAHLLTAIIEADEVSDLQTHSAEITTHTQSHTQQHTHTHTHTHTSALVSRSSHLNVAVPRAVSFRNALCCQSVNFTPRVKALVMALLCLRSMENL